MVRSIIYHRHTTFWVESIQ